MDSIGNLQRSGAIPLYYQIFSLLRDSIVAGVHPENSILPSEDELAAHFDVGRVTARRAVQELVGIGLVERRPRIGTRVIYRAKSEDGGEHDHSDMLIMLDRETVRMIDYGIVEAPANVARLMGLRPGDRVVRALRMRVFSEEPVALVESIVPEELAQFVSHEDLLRSHLHVLMRNAGFFDLHYDQWISSVGASPYLASLLKVDARSPVLCVERRMRSAENRPVALTTTHFRADRVRLELDTAENTSGVAAKLVR